MAVTEVGTPNAPTVSSGTNTPSVSPAWSGSQPVNSGDYLVCAVTNWGGTTGGTPGTPSGWTQALTVTSNSRSVVTYFVKVAAGGDAAPTVSATNTGTATFSTLSAVLHELTGQDTAIPIAITGTATGTTVNPLVATTAASVPQSGCFAFGTASIAVSTNATSTLGAGSGWTDFADNGTTNTRAHFVHATQASPTSLAQLSESFSYTGTGAFLGAGLLVVQPAGSMTVTATPASTATGASLKVMVITNATEAGGAHASAGGGGNTSLTPSFSNSLPVWVAQDFFGHNAFTSVNANNTINEQFSLSAGAEIADGYYSGTVASGTAITVGAVSADGGSSAALGVYEVPSSGGSATVDSSTQPGTSENAHTAIVSFPFVPPAGAVLAVLVSGYNNPAAWTITDSQSLTWTRRDGGSGTSGTTAIYTATAPSGGVSGSAALSGSGTLTAGAQFAAAVAMSGSGSLTPAPQFGATVALSGTGLLTSTPAFSAAAALTGTGTLTAAETVALAAALSGSGTLSAAGALSAAVALSGQGTLSAAWAASGQSAASLSGQGTLAAVSRFLAAIGLSGQGTLGGAPVRPSLAALSGSGTMSVFPKPFLLNTAAGLASGTAPTTGNSGGASGDPWDAISIGALAAIVADNTVSPHGTVSYKVSTGTTVTTALVEWTVSQGTVTTIYYRLYCFMNATPTPAWRPFSARSGASHAASVLFSGTAMQVSFGASFNTAVTFTAHPPLNRWFRVEGFFTGDPVAGVVSASLFGSMDSAVPDETHTVGGLNTVGALTQYWFGQANSAASSGPFWFGDAGISAAGPLGPTGPGSTMSGTGTLGVGGQFTGAVLLSGTGTLGGAETIFPAVHLSGSGLLVVSARFAAPAALSGQGTLGAFYGGSVPGSAALTGTGLLGVSGKISASAALSGLGALGLAPVVSAQGLAALSGSGTLTALPSVEAVSAAALWLAFQKLANIAQREGILYREAVLAGGRSWAGHQYSVAYAAENAADLAYAAWQQAAASQ